MDKNFLQLLVNEFASSFPPCERVEKVMESFSLVLRATGGYRNALLSFHFEADIPFLVYLFKSSHSFVWAGLRVQRCPTKWVGRSVTSKAKAARSPSPAHALAPCRRHQDRGDGREEAITESTTDSTTTSNADKMKQIL